MAYVLAHAGHLLGSRNIAVPVSAVTRVDAESASAQLQEQLRTAGVTDVVGPENIYRGNKRVGATFKRAHADATAWISDNQHTAGTDTPG